MSDVVPIRRKRRSEKADDELLTEVRDRYKQVLDWESDFRQLFTDDVRFCNGDSDNGYQWPDDLMTDRGSRPSLTVNKTRQHCLQVINDAKQNKPEVRITAVSDQATKEAADVYEGVVRHIEYISDAQTVYDMASEHQVQGGIGWWRLITDYEGPDSFNQEIRLVGIRDALSVYMDPDIQRRDGSDARFAFVVDDVPRDQFEAKYPEYKDNIPELGFGIVDGGWCDDEHIRVAEYYRRSDEADTLHLLPDGSSLRESELEDDGAKEQLRQVSVKSREITSEKVEWFKIVGSEVVERKDWPGKYIPLIRVVGEECVIEGKLERKGHARALKDPQRIYNYWSALALHTPLPTPSGWTTMGAVQAGDELLDEQGRPTKVLGKSPVYLFNHCHRVTFDDGSSIVADAGHLWRVEERGERYWRGKGIPGSWIWTDKVITTVALEPNKHFIVMADPLDLADADLPVDPYVLGVWLGDGISSGACFITGKTDTEALREIIAGRGHRVSPLRPHGFTVYDTWGKLVTLGLAGNKHIPEVYLRASARQRWELLQGLMDTDGSVHSKLRNCSFTTTTPQLSAGYAELLSSLGLKSVCLNREARRTMMPGGYYSDCKPSLQFSFTAPPDAPVFNLRRKADVHEAPRKTHWRRTKRFRIKSIEPVPSEPVQCLGVDAPSHLFLAGSSMVPTHNSAAVESVALQSKVPYIAAAESIEAFQHIWDKANTENFAVLPWNARDDQGQPLPKPERQEPPQMGQAYLQGLQVAQQEMMMVSGQYAPQMGQPTGPDKDASGKAIALRQRQGDTSTYHYIDNLAIAIRFTGRQLIDLIPKVYDTPRVLRILQADGTVDKVQLDPNAPQALQTMPAPGPGGPPGMPPGPPNPMAGPMMPPGGAMPPGPPGAPPMPPPGMPPVAPQDPLDTQAAAVLRIFNPKVGRYEVQADVGPSYATKRQEAFNAFTQIITSAPQLMQIAGDLMFRAADFPMAEDFAERLGRMVPPQALGKGPPPEVQQAQQQLQGAQAHVALLSEKLAVAEMKLKAKDAKDDVKAYDAVTGRLETLLNAADTDSPYVSGGELRVLIGQLVRDALATGGLSQVADTARQGMLQAAQGPGGPPMPGMPPGGPGGPPGMPLGQGGPPPGMMPPMHPAAPPGTPPGVHPGVFNGQHAALSPVPPPAIRPPMPAGPPPMMRP